MALVVVERFLLLRSDSKALMNALNVFCLNEFGDVFYGILGKRIFGKT